MNQANVYCIWPSVDRATITSAWDIWFLQLVCELYIEEDVLFIISMHPANEWMWTPDLGVRQFCCWEHGSNGVVELVYSTHTHFTWVLTSCCSSKCDLYPFKSIVFDSWLQALKVLRCAEFAPFVVFIAAPTLTGINDVHVSIVQHIFKWALNMLVMQVEIMMWG